MAEKLMEMYEKAFEMGNVKARFRLAVLTGIPTLKAKVEPDTPELVQRFEEALKELEKEFKA